MADALGMVEVGGLATAVVAANIALNTADVRIQGFGYLHEGTVMLSVRGSVAAVQMAVAAVKERSEAGAVRTSSVLARVDDAVEPVLVERTVRIGARVGAPRVPGRGRAYEPPDRSAEPGDSKSKPSQRSKRQASATAESGGTSASAPAPPASDGDGSTT